MATYICVTCGSHFEGSAVLHWSTGADGKGALLTGDTVHVIYDRIHVSFMHSYPNYIPMNAAKVRRIEKALEPFKYDRIYGAWFDRVIDSDAQKAVKRSVERYIKAISD